MRKVYKLVAALPLALLLTTAGIATAQAAGPGLDENGVLYAVDPDNPAQAGITKVLELPVGTPVPTANLIYNFLVTKDSVDSDPAQAGTAPDLNPAGLSVTFTPADTPDSPADTTAPDVVTYTKELGDLFDGVTFPHAGVYVYTISEQSSTNGSLDMDPTHLTLTYSTGSYTLTVYVENAVGGGTYVAGLTDKVATVDNGSQTAGAKVDPTPGGDGTNYGHSQMVFTNTYVTQSTLSISKTVDGAFANMDQYFNFSLTLTPSAIDTPTPTSYQAYVIEGGVVVDPTPNAGPDMATGEDDQGQPYLIIPASGTPQVNLKSGQSLNFVSLAVGTSYTVTENDPIGYLPSYTVTSGGEEVATSNDPEPVGETLGTGSQLVGTGANQANFTNSRMVAAPTGLDLNDLPYIGVAALALVALVAFVVVKARRAARRS